MLESGGRAVAVIRLKALDGGQPAAGWHALMTGAGLGASLREEDRRWIGDDQLVALLDGVGSAGTARRIAERIAAATCSALKGAGLWKVMVGVAWDTGGNSLEVLEHRAEAAAKAGTGGPGSVAAGDATNRSKLPSSASPSVFVGRETELGVLRDALHHALAGEPRLVGVEGEAGIGKTALLRALVERAGRTTLLWATGDEEETRLPFGVLSQLAAAAPAGTLADIVGRLSSSADPLLVGAGFLGDLAGLDKPVLVIVDDAHLADRESLSALRFALRRLSHDRVLAVLAFRPEGRPALGAGWDALLDRPPATMLRLAGLGPIELIALSAALGSGPLSPAGAGRLFIHTRGHPLYVRMLLEQLSVAVFERAGTVLPVPASVAGTVVARLATCGRGTQLLLEAAAVMGESAALEAVAGVAGLTDYQKPMQEAIATGLVVEVTGTPREEIRFTHPLVRAAVYHELDPNRRRMLHAGAARVVPGRAGLSHRVAAAEGPDEALAAELEAAARFEAERSRVAIAAAELDRALDLTPPGPGRARRLLAAIEARLEAGDAIGAAAGAADLSELEPDAWVDYVAGFLALVQGQLADGRVRLERAWRALAAGASPVGAPGDLDARVATMLAIIATFGLDYEQMVVWGDAAVAAGPSSGWVSSLAWTARSLGMGLVGRTADALVDLENLDRPGAPGLDALVARGLLRVWNDDLAGANNDLTSALERAARGEPLQRPSFALGARAEAAYRLGRLDEAALYGELAVATAAEAGRGEGMVLFHYWACFPKAAQGEWEEAESHAEQAAAWAALAGTASARAFPAGARAAIADARGDAEGFVAAATEIEGCYESREPGADPFGPVVADALSRVGRLAEAERELAAYEARVPTRPRGSTAMTVARVHGQVAAARGEWDAAAGHFQRALQLSETMRMPVEAAKVHLAAGTGAAAAGHRRAAAHHLYSALDTFDSLGARGYSQRCVGMIDQAGLAMRRRDTTIGGGLTPTEAAVARLVAERLTNREVAARLFVTPKAVEYHLGNIYAKLGVHSRRALADLPRRTTDAPD